MQARHYAQALGRALRDTSAAEQEVILKNFFALLTKRKHTKLLPHIARMLARTGLGAAVERLVVAKESDIETARASMGVSPSMPVVVDPRIIGGWRLETKNTLQDASYKRSLVELYRSIT